MPSATVTRAVRAKTVANNVSRGAIRGCLSPLMPSAIFSAWQSTCKQVLKGEVYGLCSVIFGDGCLIALVMPWRHHPGDVK